ncbi:hypothetical protein GCK72_003674 [Caenorhabditis remanei]|uniref:Uncharacterized protein n=1 Tax=Caenorhabditis remanei TaxID=31234 RepID=A0A6A5H9L5_CAERE|nr:hypothetical protein GCK72_003674 [Caenorhabditis remanei]KAF1763729.1 hypothetical protein GCK72_003674 [Caenorhabditis remanei]
MSSEMIDLNWEPQHSILHFHEFKSSPRAMTTMHDSAFCTTDGRYVKAMRQRRREAGLDVENYTIQDVMRMARRSASDSPINDDMHPYPINEN